MSDSSPVGWQRGQFNRDLRELQEEGHKRKRKLKVWEDQLCEGWEEYELCEGEEPGEDELVIVEEKEVAQRKPTPKRKRKPPKPKPKPNLNPSTLKESSETLPTLPREEENLEEKTLSEEEKTLSEEYFEGIRIGILSGLKEGCLTGGAVTGKVKLFPVGPTIWTMMKKTFSEVLKEVSLNQNSIVLRSKEQLIACEVLFGTKWFEWERYLRNGDNDPNPLYVGTVAISFWKVRVFKGKNKALPSYLKICWLPDKQKVNINFHFYYELASQVVMRGCKNPEQLLKKQIAHVASSSSSSSEESSEEE
jgi:hypothetical protein